MPHLGISTCNNQYKCINCNDWILYIHLVWVLCVFEYTIYKYHSNCLECMSSDSDFRCQDLKWLTWIWTVLQPALQMSRVHLHQCGVSRQLDRNKQKTCKYSFVWTKNRDQEFLLWMVHQWIGWKVYLI